MAFPKDLTRRKSFFRRLERCCCTTLAYFPLAFVYGLTTWAVWVEVNVSFLGTAGVLSYAKAVLGAGLWALANVCYTTAVFTGPGSPVDERRDASVLGAKGRGARRKGGGAGYEGLPTYEDGEDEEQSAGLGLDTSRQQGMTMVTAKSTGHARYCKKCQRTKPDRTHHCSSCGQCVLKMDHHCPWLATCVGLRNYKPFLLFLSYTSAFCWVCFLVSATWVWAEIIDDVQMDEGLLVVNTILLAVLSGIIGLVLSGFTGWHIYLAATGQTTIESLENTRYLSPLRKSLEHQPSQRHYADGELRDEEQSLGDQLKEIHANALPGVLRPEEGEDSRDASRATTPAPLPTAAYAERAHSDSPARDSLQHTFARNEEQRERDRYAAYLDEVDSEKLPNAFDMGWRRNLTHVFGHQPLFWFLPVCNTSGDGWQWAVSPKWEQARDEQARQRAQQRQREATGFHTPPAQQQGEFMKWTPGQGFVDRARNVAPPRQRMSPSRHPAPDERDMQMQPLDRRKGQSSSDEGDSYDTSSSSDEDMKRMYGHVGIQGHGGGGMGDWNDVPDDFLSPSRKGQGAGVNRSRSRGRRKGD